MFIPYVSLKYCSNKSYQTVDFDRKNAFTLNPKPKTHLQATNPILIYPDNSYINRIMHAHSSRSVPHHHHMTFIQIHISEPHNNSLNIYLPDSISDCITINSALMYIKNVALSIYDHHQHHHYHRH